MSMWNTAAEQQLTRILQDLIRVKSINPPGNERAAAEYLQNILQEAGIQSRIIEKVPNRSNLVAVVEGKTDKNPILLLSHLDVVPVKQEEWSFDGFSGDVVDGYLHGRGTIDTKQLTAMELIALLLLVKENRSFDRTVIFIASADEEGGSAYGMQYLTETYPEYFPGNAWTISEGGGFIVSQNGIDYRYCVCGEKGKCTLEITINREAELSTSQLMEKANSLLNRLSSYKSPEIVTEVMQEFQNTIPDATYTDPTLRNMWEYGIKNDMQICAFDIDADGLAIAESLTDADNLVNTGSSENPGDDHQPGLKLKVDFKLIPGTTQEECRKLFTELLKTEQVEWNLTGYTPGYLTDMESAFSRTIKQVSKNLDPEPVFLPMIALGNTDGRFIGHDVFGYSPMLNDMPFSRVLTMVHGNDEQVSLPSLFFGGQVIYEVLRKLVLEGTEI